MKHSKEETAKLFLCARTLPVQKSKSMTIRQLNSSVHYCGVFASEDRNQT